MDRVDLKRAKIKEGVGHLALGDRQDRLLIGQVMTTSPSCISPQTTALELIELFHAKRFRHMLVTDGRDRLVGVISDRDVIRCLGPGKSLQRDSLTQITAADLMSTDLVTVRPSTPVERAAVLMIDEGISCLPVLADGLLAGIVTNTDLHVVLQILLEALRRSSSEEPLWAITSRPQN